MSTFIPAPGLLVTSVTVSSASSEFLFYFIDSDEDSTWRHYQSICRIQDFKAEPHFCGYIDGTTEAVVSAGNSDVAIHRHYTTWTELLAVCRLWSSWPVGLHDWLSEVSGLPLADIEKKRILDAISVKQ